MNRYTRTIVKHRIMLVDLDFNRLIALFIQLMYSGSIIAIHNRKL
jgi:hypothetical protein